VESLSFSNIDEFWSSCNKEPAADSFSTRVAFGLGFGSAFNVSTDWHNTYFSLGRALLTTRPEFADATAVWGNSFFSKGVTIFAGPRQCYNQGYIARMTPSEFDAAVKSGEIQISEPGKVAFGTEVHSHPSQCIEKNKNYWNFLNGFRRICLENRAVLYHSVMEAPFVQLMETEFDEPTAASGRRELYANIANIKDFKSIYSDWVAQYRAKWSVGQTLILPPLAQRILLATPKKLETFKYELQNKSEHCIKVDSRKRQINCLANGIETARRELKAFRDLNTEAVIALAESRLEGKIDLAKYELARRRFVEALDKTTKDACVSHRIVDAKILMECIIECCSLNPSSALNKIAQRLGEILGFSCGLHFGSANVLSGIAAKVEHPERTFRDIFGEISFQARCEMLHFETKDF